MAAAAVPLAVAAAPYIYKGVSGLIGGGGGGDAPPPDPNALPSDQELQGRVATAMGGQEVYGYRPGMFGGGGPPAPGGAPGPSPMAFQGGGAPPGPGGPQVPGAFAFSQPGQPAMSPEQQQAQAWAARRQNAGDVHDQMMAAAAAKNPAMAAMQKYSTGTHIEPMTQDERVDAVKHNPLDLGLIDKVAFVDGNGQRHIMKKADAAQAQAGAQSVANPFAASDAAHAQQLAASQYGAAAAHFNNNVSTQRQGELGQYTGQMMNRNVLDFQNSQYAPDQRAFINNLENPNQPSAAQAMLQKSTDANMASSFALASARPGSGALGARQAMLQNSQLQQQSGLDATMLRAREDQAHQAMLGQALGQYRSQDQGDQQMQNAARLQQAGMNDAASQFGIRSQLGIDEADRNARMSYFPSYGDKTNAQNADTSATHEQNTQNNADRTRSDQIMSGLGQTMTTLAPIAFGGGKGAASGSAAAAPAPSSASSAADSDPTKDNAPYTGAF